MDNQSKGNLLTLITLINLGISVNGVEFKLIQAPGIMLLFSSMRE